MIRNINQSHYTPGVANLYNSWEWDQSRFFYLTSWITGYTHHMLTADTALCIKRQSENRKKMLQCTYFGKGCTRTATQACLFAVDWRRGQADKAALHWQICNRAPTQSEYLDSLRMRLVMLPQTPLQSAGRLYRFVQCSAMPSEEGAMKIACFSFLVWSAHTGHFGYLFIFCIFQKLVCHVNLLILSGALFKITRRL